MAYKGLKNRAIQTIACLLLLAAAVLVSGCNRYWYQSGISFDQAVQDWEDCEAELRKRSTLDNRWSSYPVEFEKACMKQKGYELLREGKLPLTAKRQDPESVDLVNFGVAGELDNGDATLEDSDEPEGDLDVY
ncbi:hypothetical protein STSP2_01819 [Anaerohalosphaera lusitana]|uniref:Uncharacterized protein n=1 Tax=Anaerohalosphaera lusitana TaxID=1936003 RepID=A0A1U9NM32_9BACT|nr:hypothetical protein [Anaerohalosphaera lusitana]AQT68650.1 hypothetical protein STSP2_01819 [Anaerohalosphaera lusitana]